MLKLIDYLFTVAWLIIYYKEFEEFKFVYFQKTFLNLTELVELKLFLKFTAVG